MTVQEFLDSLPTDPDEIAAKFEAMGVRGKQNCNYEESCVLAVAISLATEGRCSVDIRYHSQVFGFTDRSHCPEYDESYSWFDLPEHVGEFVKAFDAGRYPSLIAEPAGTPA